MTVARNQTWGGSAKPGHPEDALQRSLVSHHCVAVDQTDAILFAVPNGEKREKATAARLSGISSERRDALPENEALRPFGLGVLPGVADLVLILPLARVIWIELKIPRVTWPPAHLPCQGKREVIHEAGALSKAQRRFRKGVLDLGHQYRVIRYLGCYVELLDACGVPQRSRPVGPGIWAPAA